MTLIGGIDDYQCSQAMNIKVVESGAIQELMITVMMRDLGLEPRSDRKKGLSKISVSPAEGSWRGPF